MTQYNRADRVGGLIQSTISDILLRDTGDPRLEMVTISAVKMTRDLRIARVYFSTSGGDKRIKAAAQALEHAKGFFKRALGNQLNLRYMPDLQFYYDESFDYGSHIDNILKSISEDQ